MLLPYGTFKHLNQISEDRLVPVRPMKKVFQRKN
ncbi:hypothetical protein CLV95_10427 [Leptospira borgpetersenii serovar Javanica]|nr:hypothetical protein CLV95_10427 [Leptospira borgpetersenii serovar Javanica]